MTHDQQVQPLDMLHSLQADNISVIEGWYRSSAINKAGALMTLRLELVFKDRIGIVADISAVIARFGINIVSMEVEQREDRAHVFLEARKGGAAKSFFEPRS